MNIRSELPRYETPPKQNGTTNNNNTISEE